MRRILGLACGFGLLMAAGGAQAAGTLRFGLEFDPDVLDTARNGSYTDRIVFTSMCDQLLDIDAKLNFVPQLATRWEWSEDALSLTLHLRDGVRFQDGTPLDAEAVRLNLERYRSAPESIRKTELKPITGVDVLDPLTLRIRLSTPYAPLLSLLANRPGTPLSPKILTKSSDEIAAHPVCAGPFSFTSRVAQDRIVLDRFPGYWNASAIHFDRIEFRTIVDSTVRLVNLQSGAIDVVNRLAATDVAAVKANPKLRLATSPSLGYQLISFNVAHGPAADTPLGRDPRVRAAFEKAIDRAALNQVVFEGLYVPSNQTEAPGSRYWNPAHPVPPRDVAGAKALLKEAGVERVAFTFLVGNDPVNGQIGQVIQAMAAEAGFDIKIEQRESASLVASTKAGNYQAAMVIWSGRPDPDGNSTIWMSCGGFVNWGQYCNKSLDALFVKGAAITDPAQRVPVYRQISDIYTQDRSHMVLFHFTWLWGLSDKVEGFAPMPDGLMRPQGVRFRN
ncbi:ABC transporter substrate-binding protein [Limobrevibacterium gyesilva]|uniref:ABC transporter substrate-binding protein n=1 Tax=Limobrevibacterium gyesilva TaxID=2991712 RepID=A0AA41YVF0_9PROT|nr:ABC transporter substrate-binding protein [Limobrevibacterium gyesilva]MCW3476112.1 ABC transporter substrate-binding protein [Limobrevibacterium gyesilva]